jgi:hypothetical protein
MLKKLKDKHYRRVSSLHSTVILSLPSSGLTKNTLQLSQFTILMSPDCKKHVEITETRVYESLLPIHEWW